MSSNMGLTVKITADGKDLESVLVDSSKLTEDLGRAGKQAGIAVENGMNKAKRASTGFSSKTRKGIESISTQLGRMQTLAASAFAVTQVSAGIQSLFDMSDAYSNTTARLNLATKSQNEYNTAYRELTKITRNSFGDFGATVDLYSAMSRATQELHLQQSTLLTVTDTVNKAIKVSGASNIAAEAATTQLGQAMASGVLRGEELNSIMEQTPRIARAIADGAGIAYGDLRKAAEQGLLTSEVVIKALEKEAATIDAEFSRIPPTIASATLQIHNSMVQIWGDFTTTSGAASGLADSILFVADNLKAMALAGVTAIKLLAGAYFGNLIKAKLASIAATKAAQAAEFQAAQVAVAAAQRKVIAAKAYLGTTQRATTAVLELAAAEKVLAATGAARSASIMRNIGLSRKGTRESLAGLGQINVISNILFAAWAGWEIGTYMSDQFSVVKQAGIAMAGGLDDLLVNMTFGFKVAGETIKLAFNKPFDVIQASFAKLVGVVAKGLEFLKLGSHQSNKNMLDFADSLNAGADGATTFTKKLEALNAERKKQLKANDNFYSGEFAAAGVENNPSASPSTNPVVGSTSALPALKSSKDNAAAKAENERQQLAQLAIAKQHEESLARINLKREENAQLQRMDKLSASEALKSERKLQAQIYEADLLAAQQQVNLLLDKPVQHQTALNKIETIQRKHDLNMLKMQHKLALEQQKQAEKIAADKKKKEAKTLADQKKFWDKMFAPMTSAFQKSVNGMIQGTLTFRKAMKQMGQSIVLEFASMGVKMVVNWVKAEVMKTAATVAGTTARTGAEAAGAGETLLISAGTAAKTIMMKAWDVMAGVYSALASIPYVGPILAPIAAGAAFGVVAGYAGRVASASGGYDIPAGVNPMTQLHQQEMVLPAHIANPLRDMISGGGQGGGSTTTIQVNAMDAKSFEGYLKKNSSSMSPALKKLSRNFAR